MFSVSKEKSVFSASHGFPVLDFWERGGGGGKGGFPMAGASGYT